MSRNLDVALLRTFVAIADHGSMTAAANSLHLTQSAVSQQVARLEDLAGPLFVRGQRRVRLTAAGERLLPGARGFIATNDELWGEMTPGALKAAVRLGAPPDLVGAWLPPILRGFAQAYPLVEVALTCAASPDLLDAVAAGTLDLALAEEPPGAPGACLGACLMVDGLVWVGVRGGMAHLRRPLPVSLVAETCAFRPAVLEALAMHGLAWRTLHDGGGTDVTNATVRADLAVTTWLRSTVPPDLVVLGPDSGLPDLPRFAVTLRRAKGRAAPAVAELERQIRSGLAGRQVAA